MPNNYYDVIDVQPITGSVSIDPTQPGQLARVNTSQAATEMVQTVYQHLPAYKQTDDAMNALFMCLAQAPDDFADIARRHNVGPTEITVTNNHQRYELNRYDQRHYDNQQYDQRLMPTISPTIQPNITPTFEFNPVITIDANSLANSRSHQDNSGNNNFWGFVFIAIFSFAFVGLIGGK